MGVVVNRGCAKRDRPALMCNRLAVKRIGGGRVSGTVYKWPRRISIRQRGPATNLRSHIFHALPSAMVGLADHRPPSAPMARAASTAKPHTASQ